ncbi:HAD family phosphatase [Candidatus Uhrbacteria bacterium]|nr:HAD family phosphatase [Candidatus Uhrbacteria bacterium]
MKKENNIKIVLFDMEGTLFKGVGIRADGSRSVSAWALLAERMGPAVNAAEFEHYKKWRRGEYASYLPWMEDTSALFKKEGITKDFFDQTINSMGYVSGVKETFTALHGSGIRTGVITGGFYEQAEKAMKELGLGHARASSRFFWDEHGVLSHWEFEEHGLEGKIRAAQEIAAHYGVPLKDCAFVGDGDNDVHVAKAVGTSIAFNGEEKLRQVATHAVDQEKGKEDFRVILDYLL